MQGRVGAAGVRRGVWQVVVMVGSVEVKFLGAGCAEMPAANNHTTNQRRDSTSSGYARRLAPALSVYLGVRCWYVSRQRKARVTDGHVTRIMQRARGHFAPGLTLRYPWWKRVDQ